MTTQTISHEPSLTAAEIDDLFAREYKNPDELREEVITAAKIYYGGEQDLPRLRRGLTKATYLPSLTSFPGRSGFPAGLQLRFQLTEALSDGKPLLVAWQTNDADCQGYINGRLTMLAQRTCWVATLATWTAALTPASKAAVVNQPVPDVQQLTLAFAT